MDKRERVIKEIMKLLKSDSTDLEDLEKLGYNVDQNIRETYLRVLELFKFARDLHSISLENIENSILNGLPNNKMAYLYKFYQSLVNDLLYPQRIISLDVPDDIKTIIKKYDYYFSGKKRFTINGKGIIKYVFLSNDILAVAYKRQIQIWNLLFVRLDETINVEYKIRTIYALCDGKLAVIFKIFPEVHIYAKNEIIKIKVRNAIKVLEDSIGQIIIKTYNCIEIWTFRLEHIIEEIVEDIAVCGTKIITLRDDLKIWDSKTGELEYFEKFIDIPQGFSFSNNNILISFITTNLEIFDISGKIFKTLYLNNIMGHILKIDDKLFAITRDKTRKFMLYDINKDKELNSLSPVRNFGILPDGKILLLTYSELSIMDSEPPYSTVDLVDIKHQEINDMLVYREWVITEGENGLTVWR